MKLALLMILLGNPLAETKPPPKPPENPVIKFLNEDLWELQELTKQCINTPNNSLYMNVRDISTKGFFVIIKVKF